ncbi:MAG: hypothetical protein EZS28_010744 [Streblomastix strix]|uniref:Uncharacterized protein n=1 Tax=Streblomastix strix TaxID=222440 RepID=A0A5J4WFS1_9EUKA|nr:MAG: hypothetical protein EZS28_010744 [Streblomastix strix]
MTKKLSEAVLPPYTLDEPNENAKIDEIPLLVNILLSENSDVQSLIAERLLAMALHDQDGGQSISQLFLNPLIIILKSKDEDHSQTACEALSKLIRKSQNIQKAVTKSGFAEMASFALIEEGAPQHVQTNILIVILDLITSGADIRTMGVLLPVLEKLVQEKDSQKQEITMKASIIQTILTSKGITGYSTSSEIQELKKKNEESKRHMEEQKRLNEEQKQQIIDLEHQFEEAKPKTGDVAFSINVPTGSYTKKDGEYTYTSTAAQFKVFPIKPVITEGIYKCEFKGTFNTGCDWIGVMKAGHVIPFGSHANQHPYAKDSMFFYNGYINYYF